jgi:hypothetical protein
VYIYSALSCSSPDNVSIACRVDEASGDETIACLDRLSRSLAIMQRERRINVGLKERNLTYRDIYAHTVLMWMNMSGFVAIVAVVENHKT